MPKLEQQQRQRERLERLADVVYGVAIVLLVAELPSPHSEGLKGLTLLEFLGETYEIIVGAVVGLFLVVTYWMQSNAVNGILTHTDNRHSALVVSQLIVMMFYFYTVGLSTDLGHPMALLFVQSVSLAGMGLIGISGLYYAAGKGALLGADVDAGEIRALRNWLVPEPLTATLTIAAAPFGIDAWSLTWLSYPLVTFAVRRLAPTTAE